ncbi:hypothetical protein CAEBREN_16363 [Caenorhabditis brenneri]|uniref:histone acetyltransferase n=1 Tax=Caenorhabditis brenneri TaxID=135651 RepID=G0MAE8_CAEBE|nr:hypothetical protein CAEBREN_16363 [Caenorhabditis brenneri]
MDTGAVPQLPVPDRSDQEVEFVKVVKKEPDEEVDEMRGDVPGSHEPIALAGVGANVSVGETSVATTEDHAEARRKAAAKTADVHRSILAVQRQLFFRPEKMTAALKKEYEEVKEMMGELEDKVSKLEAEEDWTMEGFDPVTKYGADAGVRLDIYGSAFLGMWPSNREKKDEATIKKELASAQQSAQSPSQPPVAHPENHEPAPPTLPSAPVNGAAQSSHPAIQTPQVPPTLQTPGEGPTLPSAPVNGAAQSSHPAIQTPQVPSTLGAPGEGPTLPSAPVNRAAQSSHPAIQTPQFPPTFRLPGEEPALPAAPVTAAGQPFHPALPILPSPAASLGRQIHRTTENSSSSAFNASPQEMDGIRDGQMGLIQYGEIDDFQYEEMGGLQDGSEDTEEGTGRVFANGSTNCYPIIEEMEEDQEDGAGNADRSIAVLVGNGGPIIEEMEEDQEDGAGNGNGCIADLGGNGEPIVEDMEEDQEDGPGNGNGSNPVLVGNDLRKMEKYATSRITRSINNTKKHKKNEDSDSERDYVPPAKRPVAKKQPASKTEEQQEEGNEAYKPSWYSKKGLLSAYKEKSDESKKHMPEGQRQLLEEWKNEDEKEEWSEILHFTNDQSPDPEVDYITGQETSIKAVDAVLSSKHLPVPPEMTGKRYYPFVQVKSANYMPPTLFLSQLTKADQNMGGEDIVRLGKESAQENMKRAEDKLNMDKHGKLLPPINKVYNSEHLRRARQGKSYKPRYFIENGFQFKGTAENGTLQPIASVRWDHPNLKEILSRRSISLVDGCMEAVDTAAFSLEKMKKLKQDNKYNQISALRERAQSHSENQQFEDSENTIRGQFLGQKIKLALYIKHHQELTSKFRSGLDKFLSKDNVDLAYLKEFDKELREMQHAFRGFHSASFPLITFGSNIDVITSEMHIKAIEKLNAYMRPNGELSEVLKELILGVNTIQIYLKGPGCRTFAHWENSGLASININIGPDDCIWFAISLKYAADVEFLLCQNGIKQDIIPVWPLEEVLRKNGIPFYKFVQKPGQGVHISVGTYHWVQSTGNCTNISWNVLEDSLAQMAALALFHDFFVELNNAIVLPVECIFWECAEQKKNAGGDFAKLVKKFLIRSLGHCAWELEMAQSLGFTLCGNDQLPRSSNDHQDDCQFFRCREKNCTQNPIFNIIYSIGPAFNPRCYNCVSVLPVVTIHLIRFAKCGLLLIRNTSECPRLYQKKLLYIALSGEEVNIKLEKTETIKKVFVTLEPIMEMNANSAVSNEPTAAPPSGTSSRPAKDVVLTVPKQEIMDDDVVEIVPPKVQEIVPPKVQEEPDVVAKRKAAKLTDDVVNATFAAQCTFGNLPIDLEGAQKKEFDKVEDSLNKFHLEVKTFAAEKVWSMDGFKRIVKNATVPVYAMRNFESGFGGKEDVEREDYKKSIKEAADNLKTTVNELRKEKETIMIGIEESAYLGIRPSDHKLKDIKKELAEKVPESAQSVSQPPIVRPEDSAPTVPTAAQDVPTLPFVPAPTTVQQEPSIPLATTEAPSHSSTSTVTPVSFEAPPVSAALKDGPALSALTTPTEAPTTSADFTVLPGLPVFSDPTGIPVSSAPPTPVAPETEEIPPVNNFGASSKDTIGKFPRYSPNPSMDFESKPLATVRPSAVGSDVTRKRSTSADLFSRNHHKRSKTSKTNTQTGPYSKALQQKRSASGTNQDGCQIRSRITCTNALAQSNVGRSEIVVATNVVEGTPMEISDSLEMKENKEPAKTRVTQADQKPVRMFKSLEEIETANSKNSKDVVQEVVNEITVMIESAAEQTIFLNFLEQVKLELLRFESDKITSFTKIHKLFNKALSTVEQEDIVTKLKKAHCEFIDMFKALGLCCGSIKEELLQTIGCDEGDKCRIRRDDKYYHYKNAVYDFAICVEHFDLLEDRFRTRDNKKILHKTDFDFKTHDEVENEAMEVCSHCGKHWHDSCRMNQLFANRSRSMCFKNHDDSIKKINAAENIPITVASDRIEEFVNDKIIGTFPGAKKISIREVATKITTIKSNNKMSKFLKKTTGESLKLKYRYRQFIAVQKMQGRELLLFSFSVQEYLDGFKEGWTNVEYVDSVKYVLNPKLRTTIYQTILLGYFKFAASIGFQHAHIFAMAPQEGDSFFFRGRPESQKVSNQEHLINWYHNFLNIGKEDIIDSFKTMDYSSDYEMLAAPELLKSLYFVGGLFTYHFEQILKEIKISLFNNKSRQAQMKKDIEKIANENANNLFYIDLKPTETPVVYVEYKTSTEVAGEEDEWINFQETEKLEFSSLDQAHYATLMIVKKIIMDMDSHDSLKLLQMPNEWIRH